MSSKKHLISGVALSVLLALPSAFAQVDVTPSKNSASEKTVKETPAKWSVNDPQGNFTTAKIDVRSGTWINF